MSSHVVYKIIDPQSNEVIYVGSGTKSRPQQSLKNSHITDIRIKSESLTLRVSKTMTEPEARDLEASLIRKLVPVYNSNRPRRLYEDTCWPLTDLGLQLLLTDAQVLVFDRIVRALVESPYLHGDFLVSTCLTDEDHDASIINHSSRKFSAKHLDAKGKPLKFHLQNRNSLRISGSLENLPGTSGGLNKIADRLLSILNEISMMLVDEEVVDSRFYLGQVSVFSVGFASYVKLGEDENDTKKSLGLLASLASATVTVSALDEDGENRRIVHQQLISLYDGTLSAELKGMKTQKSGYDGTSVSVVLKKTDNSRSLICSQTFYNKDVEVEDNKDLYTGKGNAAQKKILSDADLERLKTHVRVDNVFYAPYLSSWLAASVPKGTVLESTGKSILLKEIAPLYDQPILVHSMIDYMRSELGVRALALSPTVTGIKTLCSKLPLSTGKELKRWTEDSSLTAKTSKRGLLVDYDFSKLGLSYETLELMMTKYYLDLRAPFDFYVHLDSIRSRYLLDYKDVRNLALYSSGHEVSTETVKAIHTKMRESSLAVLNVLRSNLVIGNNLQAKRAFLKESTKL